MEANHMDKIINWAEVSRHITGGNRGTIRRNQLPKKHIAELDKLFNIDLPAWWAEHKQQNKEK